MRSTIVLGKGLLGSHIEKLYPQVPVISHADCDITDPFDIDAVLRKYSPEVVVNCAGIVPKNPAMSDTMQVLSTNARGPKLLQNACDEYGIKVIQISTDCVFSGIKGGYTEVDIPNPPSLYGMSKYLGEVTEYPHLTIRTSFVGFPDISRRGLLHWLHTSNEVIGYDKQFWSGLTTLELAKILFEVVIPMNLSNILHLHGERISKYTLLETIKEVYGWTITITPESSLTGEPHAEDRSLVSELPEIQSKKTFKQQVEEMKELLKDSIWPGEQING
jgi:dTDP-4-dehydrorhamnose reductase